MNITETSLALGKQYNHLLVRENNKLMIIQGDCTHESDSSHFSIALTEEEVIALRDLLSRYIDRQRKY